MKGYGFMSAHHPHDHSKCRDCGSHDIVLAGKIHDATDGVVVSSASVKCQSCGRKWITRAQDLIRALRPKEAPCR